MSEKPESTKTATAKDIAIDIAREAGCIVSATVTLGADSSKAAYLKAVKEVKKQVSIPGFRKGRAPDAMVISNYSSHVNDELRNSGARMAYDALVEQENVRPLSSEHIRLGVESASKEEIICKINLECAPDTPLIDPADLSVDMAEAELVTDADVETRIEEMREQYADFQPIDARTVKEGDTVTLDIDTLGPADADPVEPTEVCRENVFKAEKGEIGQWLLDIIVGMNPGDEAEGISEKDDTLPEGAEFVATRYKITVKNLVEKQPLSIEQLSEKVGAGEDLDAFRQTLKGRIQAEREAEIKIAAKEEITKQLFDKYDFELPKSPLEGGRRVTIKRMIRRLKEEGATEEQIKEREAAIEQEAEAFLLPRLRLMFLADKYFSTKDPEQLNIERDEMMRVYTSQLMMTAPELRIIDNEMSGEEMRNELIMEVMNNRLLDRLIEKVS